MRVLWQMTCRKWGVADHLLHNYTSVYQPFGTWRTDGQHTMLSARTWCDSQPETWPWHSYAPETRSRETRSHGTSTLLLRNTLSSFRYFHISVHPPLTSCTGMFPLTKHSHVLYVKYTRSNCEATSQLSRNALTVFFRFSIASPLSLSTSS